MNANEGYQGQRPEGYVESQQASCALAPGPLTAQESVERDVEALKRLGSKPFNSFLDDKLVGFDLSVIDTPVDK